MLRDQVQSWHAPKPRTTYTMYLDGLEILLKVGRTGAVADRCYRTDAAAQQSTATSTGASLDECQLHSK